MGIEKLRIASHEKASGIEDGWERIKDSFTDYLGKNDRPEVGSDAFARAVLKDAFGEMYFNSLSSVQFNQYKSRINRCCENIINAKSDGTGTVGGRALPGNTESKLFTESQLKKIRYSIEKHWLHEARRSGEQDGADAERGIND